MTGIDAAFYVDAHMHPVNMQDPVAEDLNEELDSYTGLLEMVAIGSFVLAVLLLICRRCHLYNYLVHRTRHAAKRRLSGSNGNGLSGSGSPVYP